MKQKGITLSALIITIIVLLILTGVSISLITGEEGIINSTISARKNYEIAQYKDQIDIAQVNAHLQDWKEEKTGEELLREIEKRLENGGNFKGSKFTQHPEYKPPTLLITTKEGYEFKVTEEEVKYIGNQEEMGDIGDITTADIQIKVTPSEWTNQNVKVSIKITNENYENHQDNYEIKYQIGNGKKETYKNEFEVEQNNIIKVELNNKPVGTLIATCHITNIDKVEPNITKLEVNNEKWTNQEITITGKATDNASGIIGYAWTNTEEEPESWEEINQTQANEEISQSKTLRGETDNKAWYFWVKDKAGNTNKKKIEINNIDTTKAEIKLTASPTTWTNNKVTLTAQVTDAKSGIIGYAWTDRVETEGSIKWNTIGSTTSTTQTKELTSEADNKTWYFWAKDEAGNTNNTAITINNIDKTAPTAGIMNMMTFEEGTIFASCTLTAKRNRSMEYKHGTTKRRKRFRNQSRRRSNLE